MPPACGRAGVPSPPGPRCDLPLSPTGKHPALEMGFHVPVAIVATFIVDAGGRVDVKREVAVARTYEGVSP
jgi:hypothetical protein